jgi:hypothetical protein
MPILRPDILNEVREGAERAEKLGFTAERWRDYFDSVPFDCGDGNYLNWAASEEEAFQRLVATLPGPLSEEDIFFLKRYLDQTDPR